MKKTTESEIEAAVAAWADISNLLADVRKRYPVGSAEMDVWLGMASAAIGNLFRLHQRDDVSKQLPDDF